MTRSPRQNSTTSRGGVEAIRSGAAVPEVEVLNVRDRYLEVGKTSVQVATFTPVDVSMVAGRSVTLILEDQLNAVYVSLPESASETSVIEPTMTIRTRSTWGDVEYPSVGGVTLTVDFESGACYAICYGDADSAIISHIEVVIKESVVPALAEYVAKRYTGHSSRGDGTSVNATISQLLQDAQDGYDIVVRMFYENSTTYFEDYRLASAQFDSNNNEYNIRFIGVGSLSGFIDTDHDEWTLIT